MHVGMCVILSLCLIVCTSECHNMNVCVCMFVFVCVCVLGVYMGVCLGGVLGVYVCVC